MSRSNDNDAYRYIFFERTINLSYFTFLEKFGDSTGDVAKRISSGSISSVSSHASHSSISSSSSGNENDQKTSKKRRWVSEIKSLQKKQ